MKNTTGPKDRYNEPTIIPYVRMKQTDVLQK